MSAKLIVICVLLVAASSSIASTAKSTRRSRAQHTPFILSKAIPDILLGDEVNNLQAQAALRAKLNMVLDTVDAHYNRLLNRVHELYEPKVSSLLKELLLLSPKGTTTGRHLTTGDSISENDDYHDDGDDDDALIGGRRSSREVSYLPPQRLPARLSALPSPRSLADWAQRVGARLAQLPPGLSFPVLRRLLTAVVVRTWLDGAGKRLSDADEEAVSGLFVQLYMLHRRGVMQRGIMDYQHVSKSGGTSWCHAAQLNGCTTQRFDKFYVCGVQNFEDKVRWLDGEAHRNLTGGEPTRWSLHGTFRSETAPGCATRAAQMRAHRWTYYSNEYTLTGGQRSMADVEVCAKQFVTSILFRNPVKRLASHLRFVLLHYKRFMGANGTAEGGGDGRGGGGGADFFSTYANANASFWQQVAPAMVDNYFSRTLLGEAIWHAPVGGLNVTHHLPAARLVLMQYDIVVPLESPTELTSRLLAFGAGWPVSYTDVHDKNITALQEQFDFDPTPYMPSREELSYLERQQVVDMQLYELAVLIGQLDYLVYSTAAAGGVVPWDAMPASVDSEDPNASFRVACGLLRGPGGIWSAGLVHRRMRRTGAGRESRGGRGGGRGGTLANDIEAAVEEARGR